MNQPTEYVLLVFDLDSPDLPNYTGRRYITQSEYERLISELTVEVTISYRIHTIIRRRCFFEESLMFGYRRYLILDVKKNNEKPISYNL